MMDMRRKRVFSGLAEAVIILGAVFILLDAVLGFTGRRGTPPVQPRPAVQISNYANLSASCTGGFSNERTVGGVTRVASHGTPFDAYQVTLSNTGDTVITVHSMDVALVNGRNEIFARHHADLGAGVTLTPGQSRQVVEAYGIGHPVASCEILGWQS